MKKAKRQDKTLIMLCIGVVFMLIVTAVMSFAYFTAKAESESQQIQFGVLELDPINNFNLTSKEGHTPIVPGCTINMAGTIKLTKESNVEAFVRFKPTVTVTKDGTEVTATWANKFAEDFNNALRNTDVWLNNSAKTEDTYLYYAGKFTHNSGEISTTNKRIIKEFNFKTFNNGEPISVELKVNEYGNEWQGVTVSIGLTVEAIQSAHVGVDNVNDTNYNNDIGSNNGDQALVNDIAEAEAWSKVESGNGSITPEPVKPATIDKLTFTIDNTNNTASVKAKETTIEGEVVIPNYIKKSGQDWVEATKDDGVPVTNVDFQAFRGCSKLTNVTIPEGVTSIGKNAFKGCSALTSVIIPEGVTSIGEGTFDVCSGLKSITIPESVTSIGEWAFGECSGLTSIIIPSGVTSIGRGAFSRCRGLTSITIPESVTSIGSSAFYDCEELESITIPSGVTSIGGSVFSCCYKLTSIAIPERVTSIGEIAFSYCKSLTSITIPSGVTSIGRGAFSSCISLESVTVEAIDPPTLGNEVFFPCSKLKSVYVPNGCVDAYKNAGGWEEYPRKIKPVSKKPTT